MNDQTEKFQLPKDPESLYRLAAEAIIAAEGVSFDEQIEADLAPVKAKVSEADPEGLVEFYRDYSYHIHHKKLVMYLAIALERLSLHKNAEILTVITGDSHPTLTEAIKVEKQCWAKNLRPSAKVFWRVMEASSDYESRRQKECRSYPEVAEYLGARVVAGPSEPDLVLGENVPVEVKIGAFNNAALRQLQRYMKQYSSKTGIAVGRELTVELPKGVTFLEMRFDAATCKYVIQPNACQNTSVM